MKKIAKAILRPPYAYARYIYLRYIKQGFYTPTEVVSQELNLSAVSDFPMSYFGYYNVSPENNKGQVLYCVPTGKDRVALYYRDANGEHEIGETKAYNLQQGCMSQWGYTNPNRAYYNRYNQSTDKYEGVVYDVDAQKEIDILPMPVYALSKQEDFALSLNFDRLAVMRPDYGYFCHKNLEMPMNDADGIWHVDVATKEVKLIITLQQLIDLKPVETMEGARHKVNHIDISPDGKRFMFLHRWVGPKGRYMRLITANADGSDMYILNGDKMTSHSYWVDNNRIVSFCHTPETGDAYVMFEDKTDNRKLLSKKLPVTDGHPSTINQGEWMVTDSYPGHDAMSRLYLYNIKTDKLICLGRFYQPLKYKGPGRIDLHPKWNMQGTHVYFESGHDGKRRLYSINVESLLK